MAVSLFLTMVGILAYPLDFSGKKKVQRFSFVFADSQYFA